MDFIIFYSAKFKYCYNFDYLLNTKNGMEILFNIDKSLLYFLNTTLANGLFDRLMPFITEQKHWNLVYLLLLIILVWKGGLKGRAAALALIIGVGMSDYLNSDILKEFFSRLRPCHTLDNIRVLIDCGPGKSFPSSHAVNNFTMAMIGAGFYREYRWILFTTAGLVAFSRVYVGVHYPFDVLGGTLVGLTLGYIIYKAAFQGYEKLDTYLKKKQSRKFPKRLIKKQKD
jgi:undecaprenyl-diphosphatase